ncbi:hypothetical protein GCM10011409_08060 [Lentibacillus populi]|uniref:Uncharacterized protein n=1 Tax=Lentibacillus populi TaxID=1827502 RepID=A0A9W5X4N8_9BACI|nr:MULTISPECIES: hypothetical protein [Bacillaceae]MBT2216016.1 hypothetical protein [Virgibacillus dakarensis]GGB33005.1 hypothetical protein GCM10011409_08060 [Lentibacillus populi]
MVDALLDFMLGSVGRSIGDFYVEHQVIFNSIVVGLALIGIVMKRKRNTENESAN